MKIRTALRSLVVMLTALSVVAASAAYTKSFAATVAFQDTGVAYCLVNAYRMEHNLHVRKKSKKLRMLKRDSKLEAIARVRAEEMAMTGQFSHTRPNGKSGLSLIKGHKAKGENIAKGQTSCEQVSAEWFASPGHRKNMLRRNFRKVGIASCTYNGVTYWAEVFSS